MKKIIRRFILFLLLIIAILAFISINFISSIRYEVNSSDLPQNVYESNGNLLEYAKTKIVGLVIASEDERYTMIEEIVNLIILDSIQKNINSEYNPLGDCNSDNCNNIYINQNYYLNYTYAYLNDANQLVIVISGGTSRFINVETALYLYFNINFDILKLSVDFTLDKYSLGNRFLSKNTLDYIFDKIDKENIENSITFGKLDLDLYQYTISIKDAF